MIVWLAASRLGRAVVGVLAALAVLAGVYAKGRIDAAQRAKIEGLQDYRETRERIDNADIGDGDADADREWLRNYGQSGGPL